MIGLLHVPSRERSPLGLTPQLRVSLLLALLAVAGTSSPLVAAKGDKGRRGVDYPAQLDRNRAAEEEPQEKPNLAERNHITPNPLMTLEEEKQFVKVRQLAYSSARKIQNPSKAEEELIREGVRNRVYRLTIPENWAQIASLRHELVNDIDRFIGDANPRTRAIALSAAVKYLTELLSDQPEVVKLNAGLLLSELNEKNADRQNGVPAIPYAGAAEPLLQTVQSSDQPTSVKVVALRGLGRILNDGKLPRSMRDRVTTVLVDELHAAVDAKPTEGQSWYEWRLIDTLGMVGEARNAIQQPLVVDALWETMLNETLPWHLRTQAARSLSQIQFDSSFNVGLIAHEIVKLSGKMTVQYNENPDLAYWRRCFMDLYLAFNPKEKRELEKGWGLRQQVESASLRTHAKLVEGAYEQVLTMVNGVMQYDPPRAVPVKTLKEAVEWLNANPPTDQKLHQGAQTVDAIRKAQAPASAENTAVSQRSRSGDGV